MRRRVQAQAIFQAMVTEKLQEQRTALRANATAASEAQQTADAALAHGARAAGGWACAADGWAWGWLVRWWRAQSPIPIRIPARGTTPPTALHIPKRRLLAAG